MCDAGTLKAIFFIGQGIGFVFGCGVSIVAVLFFSELYTRKRGG